MTYNITDIQKIIQATGLQLTHPASIVQDLLLDSRQIAAPATSLFFAIVGKRHDGHRYLADLYREGVRQFVVSQPVKIDLPEANILYVQDTMVALQQLSAHHRAQFHIPVVGITGSNGKTIVKEWLYQLLAPDYNVVRSPKSYNSQVGVPLSVWQMQSQHTLALFEAGISQPGEMALLARIIRPDIGIFTNIGSAHREGFLSKMAKVNEKMQLFDDTKTLICCIDDEKIAAASQLWLADIPGRRLLSWSKTGTPADVEITGVARKNDSDTLIAGTFKTAGTLEKFAFTIPFSDAASIENAIHCWCLLHLLKAPTAQIADRMTRLEPVEMRLEMRAAINGSTLINDFYNNDLAGLRIALRFAAQQPRTGPLTLILSDILQTGQPPEYLYKKVATAILEQKVQRLIGIGVEIPIIQDLLPLAFDAVFYPDTLTFMQNITRHDFHNDLILLKGARTFEFERIATRLEMKSHKTVLEVNLTSLVHNLNVYNRLLQPGTKTLVMVKAAGYGSGAAQIARLLEFHQVDYLGVAYADEGIELRQAGVNLPILVLNPEPANFDALYRYRLEPEVYSLPELQGLIRYTGTEKPLSIHLKLDTGMHRLGFEAEDMGDLIATLQAYPNLRVQSVFSHLAASDAQEHDGFTHAQASTFTHLYEQIADGLGYRPLRHIVNTGGISRFSQYHFDMVRLGIGLYGIDSSGLQAQLRVVNTLKATISQIKHVAPGETVGYNRNGPVSHPLRIATISIGYADGLLRLAGNGRYAVQIHGKPATTIGNICMDMAMVDVTHIPQVRAGDEVIVFGDKQPVQALAICLQTIVYEVFTNISERVKRVYWQE